MARFWCSKLVPLGGQAERTNSRVGVGVWGGKAERTVLCKSQNH